MEINIYEAKDLLYNMLNVQGFNKRILGKSKSWTDSKSLLSTKNRIQFFEIIELQFVTRDFLAQRFEIITLQP